MKLRTQYILLAVGVIIIWLGVFLSAKDLKITSYQKGYEKGFIKGLDTASAIYDQEFNMVMDSAEAILSELQSMHIESFPNHSEIESK